MLTFVIIFTYKVHITNGTIYMTVISPLCTPTDIITIIAIINENKLSSFELSIFNPFVRNGYAMQYIIASTIIQEANDGYTIECVYPRSPRMITHIIAMAYPGGSSFISFELSCFLEESFHPTR